ncbi:MAG: SIS domain-containing protein, partial [Planctomycetota bacterium]|nr:SIS domain-containing protein [Planctomycetota bacterium]
ADIVLDTGIPAGDSMTRVEGLAEPVSPGSSIGSVLLVNTIKAEVAARLTEAGSPPKVLAASCIVGKERAAELFDAAYDEHAHRIARLYENL